MKAKHSLIHDTFMLERRYPSAPAKVYRYFAEPEYRKRWFGSTEDWSRMRVHGIGEQLDLLGRVLQKDQDGPCGDPGLAPS